MIKYHISQQLLQAAIRIGGTEMAFVFLLGALYCLGLAIRRFTGGRAPYYIEKDPDVTAEQKKAWSRFNGYSLLFWSGFALMFASELLFDAWPFYIPMALCAAGGVFMSLRASNELHRELKQGFRQSGAKSGNSGGNTKNGKKKKKK